MPTLDTLTKSSLIRWKGLYILFGLGLFSFFYGWLFFDFHLKQYLEKNAKALHGTNVTISSLRTNLSKQVILIKGLQVEHHLNPTRNIFEIDTISVHFALEPFLRKKIVMEDVKVEGVRFYSNRNEALVTNEPKTNRSSSGSNLLDRVSISLYGSIHHQLNTNPLKSLNRFSSGMTTRSIIDGMEKDLESVRLVKMLVSRINAINFKIKETELSIPGESYLSSIEQRLNNLKLRKQTGEREPSQINEFNGLQSEVHSKRDVLIKATKTLSEDLDDIQEKIETFDSLVEKDCTLVRGRLLLPPADFSDLTPVLFGEKALNYLEKLSYWINLSRDRMPVKTGLDKYSWLIQKGAHGSSIHYISNVGNPSFLIHNLTIHSDTLENSDHGNVKGFITGITSDPAIYGNALTAHLEVEIPQIEITGLKLNLKIDHTGRIPKDEFDFQVTSFPINNMLITKQDKLSLSITKGKASLDGKGFFDNDSLKINWNVKFRNTEYKVLSHIKSIEDYVKEMAASFSTFDLKGELVGPFQDLNFNTTSELGKTLAIGLKREFQKQLAAIDETVKSDILDVGNAKNQFVREQVRELREGTLAPYNRILAEIEKHQVFATKLFPIK